MHARSRGLGKGLATLVVICDLFEAEDLRTENRDGEADRQIRRASRGIGNHETDGGAAVSQLSVGEGQRGIGRAGNVRPVPRPLIGDIGAKGINSRREDRVLPDRTGDGLEWIGEGGRGQAYPDRRRGTGHASSGIGNPQRIRTGISELDPRNGEDRTGGTGQRDSVKEPLPHGVRVGTDGIGGECERGTRGKGDGGRLTQDERCRICESDQGDGTPVRPLGVGHQNGVGTGRGRADIGQGQGGVRGSGNIRSVPRPLVA